MNNRYANHPIDSKKYDTSQLREHYMMEEVFIDDKIELTYSHVDRIIFGGIKPVKESLKLEAGKSMGVDYFLERREMGVMEIIYEQDSDNRLCLEESAERSGL